MSESPTPPSTDTVDEVAQTIPVPKERLKGLQAMASTDSQFDLMGAMGGWRGLIESTGPGLVFVVVFVAARELTPALIGSLALAAAVIIARLIQRSDLTQAFSGSLGVLIGVLWAWRTGEAADYFAWGFIVNAAWSLGLLISLLVRWPAFGFIVAGLQSRHLTQWRDNPATYRTAKLLTFMWLGLFLSRLLVQLPLYFADNVGALGTARLAMGVPATVLVVWLSWLVVRASDRKNGVTIDEVEGESDYAADDDAGQP